MLHLLFWGSFALLFYSFFGYGILRYVLVNLKALFNKPEPVASNFQPAVTVVVTCCNRGFVLEKKIQNCRELDYPKEKLQLLFITDGTTAKTGTMLQKYTEVNVLHNAGRSSKAAAENRAMQQVTTPIVIFTDADTLLNKDAVNNIVRHFADEKVGCVSGEKGIQLQTSIVSAAGQSSSWRYDSFWKKLWGQLSGPVGATGKLVAFRTGLYEAVPEDTVLNGFVQSMYVAASGYKIVHEAEAYATETTAVTTKEELERKIRSCAGGWQAMKRLSGRLSMVKSPVLYLHYFSYCILRWAVNPLLLVLFFFSNVSLAWESPFFLTVLYLQVFFYLTSLAGYCILGTQLKVNAFFLPYRVCIKSYSVVAGLICFLNGLESGIWKENSQVSAHLSKS
jgi:cellulose synthase/poly-beta-1,6-N-acetylglucosamine synthase-like glycosyltransferase